MRVFRGSRSLNFPQLRKRYTMAIRFMLTNNKEARRSRSTSWGRVTGWYKGAVDDRSSYHQTLIIPNLLRLCAPKKGERVLDLGCGNGIVAEQFAKAGADVVGV